MHGLIENNHHRRQSGNGKHKSPHRHFRYGERAAARRAMTAAKLKLGIPLEQPLSMRAASEMCGANPRYTEAMAVLLRAEDEHAIAMVLRGSWPLLETAARLKPRADLLAAFRRSDASDHREVLGRQIGVNRIWDEVINPLI
jgi:hypothetical protein